MKEKKSVASPRKLKQTTLSNLWSSSRPEPNSVQTATTSTQVKLKKRKGDDDLLGSPVKKLSLDINCRPESGENSKEKENILDLDEFFFEDFENNPFLSPKNGKLSPKKSPHVKVLTENCSQSSEEDNWLLEASNLSFEIPRRCKVTKVAVVSTGHFEQVLSVSDEKTEEKGMCRLRDVWTFSGISPGDLVVIQAERFDGGWIVDNKAGYVVLHPNIILSSTSLVKSSFCMRKGLLANFYKSIDAGTNSRMVVGKLVHELLQKSFRIGTCTDDDFASFVSQYLQACDYLHDYFFCGVNFKEIKKEVESFVPSIRTFLDIYIKKKMKPYGKNFAGSIEEVLDIEELIRSPMLGFQGRIDATLKIKSKNKEKIAPLELKTGKASFSIDHRSQLTLYVMLMNEIGRNVESGLLLYLKDGVMEEIVPTRDEIRNLFLMRNRLVGYFKSLRENELPEPIRSSTCTKCPYLRVCTSYLKSENLYENHPLRNMDFPDIKPSHLDYFRRWNKLLWLEYGDALNEDIEDTEIDQMILKPEFEKISDEYRHNFEIPAVEGRKYFQAGTFVHVYEGSSYRICTAKVVSITPSSCCLSMEKQLTNFDETYRIAVFKFKFFNMYLSNIGLLLEESREHLREIVIDRRISKFDEKMDKKSFKEKCLGKLLSLNKEQQKAVVKSILCRDYMLIKGPPGTGKTQTIAALVRVFLALDKKVLIAGHTNTSVDNMLLRLTDVDFLRLGSIKSVNKKLMDKCYAVLSKKCSTFEEIKSLFDRKLFASTCSGIDEDFLAKMKFDVCIVDESSQALECEILRPLFCSEKFILVGDEDQLPPIVQNPEARKLGMSESLFERLQNDQTTVRLKYQYRMNSTINALANSIAYKGLIECANTGVANATIRITNEEAFEKSVDWIKESLSPLLEKSVMFVDTSDYFKWKGIQVPEKRRSSKLEGNLVKTLLISLKKFGLKEEEIGVIAPFGDQISLLKGKLTDCGCDQVELNTVDQYQGRDKEVILFSCGKENQPETEVSDLELLNDSKRLTVAVSRAKHKLVVVGDKSTVEKYEPFRKLLASLEEYQHVSLENGKNGFFWKDLEC